MKLGFGSVLLLLGLCCSFSRRPASDFCRSVGCINAHIFLGETGYSLEIHQVSQSGSIVRFSEDNPRLGSSGEFHVPGIASDFGQIGTDIFVTFVTPGPSTRIFGLVRGHVQQNLECTSRFGASKIETPLQTVLACFEGSSIIGNQILPETAKLYVQESNSYRLKLECPFDKLYEQLAVLQSNALERIRKKVPGH